MKWKTCMVMGATLALLCAHSLYLTFRIHRLDHRVSWEREHADEFAAKEIAYTFDASFGDFFGKGPEGIASVEQALKRLDARNKSDEVLRGPRLEDIRLEIR